MDIAALDVHLFRTCVLALSIGRLKSQGFYAECSLATQIQQFCNFLAQRKNSETAATEIRICLHMLHTLATDEHASCS